MRSHIRRYPWQARTHTYYYDATAGADTNTGTAENLPLQTIADLNARALKPGDRVFLKRAETFTGQLAPTYSGKAGRLILYGAFGTGALPIVDGSTTERALTIQGGAAHHLSFENIVFSASTGEFAVVSVVSYELYFRACQFLDSPDDTGFSSSSADGALQYRIRLDDCIASGNAEQGFYVGSETGALGPREVLFVGCTAHTNGTSIDADHGFYVKFGCTIDRCVAYSNSCAGYKLNCELVEDSPFAPVLKNSIAYDNRIGFFLSHVGATIFNNLFYGNTSYNMQLHEVASNCLIYFNTFVNVDAGVGHFGIAVNNTNAEGNTFTNNLIVDDFAVNSRFSMASTHDTDLSDTALNNTFDYNAYYCRGTTTDNMFYDDGVADAFVTWAGWQAYAASPDPNSTCLLALPGFVTRYTDLHPADGGNLKALGVAIAGYELDRDGHTRANPPTPGCYDTASA